MPVPYKEEIKPPTLTWGHAPGSGSQRRQDLPHTLKVGKFTSPIIREFYVAGNKAFGDRFELATKHWFATGYKEGRQSSAGFDIASYILRYSDLDKVFITTEKVDYIGAWKHWNQYGHKEHRNPAPLGVCKADTAYLPELEKAEFDPCFYLHIYADLKKAFGDDWGRARRHWKEYGIHEGRQSARNFAIRDYLIRYDDLRRAYMRPLTKVEKQHQEIKNAAEALRAVAEGSGARDIGTDDLVVNYSGALNHWHIYGKKEGRNPGPLPACGTTGGIAELRKNVLDPCDYVNRYPDLIKAFGRHKLAATAHWFNYGRHEGRQSNVDFSVDGYLTRYLDLQKVYLKKWDPDYAGALEHWFEYGRKEKRNATPIACDGPEHSNAAYKKSILDPCFYLNRYPKSLKKPLRNLTARAIKHWIVYGIDEGRQSNYNLVKS